MSAPPCATHLLPAVRWQGAHAEQQGIDAWIAQGLAEPALAWVEYDRPAVIYGRRGGLTPERQACAAQRGCALLARRSGGGAVLAGPWMLGLHLWLPRAHVATRLSAAQAMVAVGTPVAQALADAGVANRMAGAAEMTMVNARVKDLSLDWNCFAGLSHGELLDGSGRKCFGLAQARTAAGVLLSAGLLTAATPWETLDEVHQGQASHPSPAGEFVSAGLDLHDRERLQQLITAGLWAWLDDPQSAPDGARRLAATMEA